MLTSTLLYCKLDITARVSYTALVSYDYHFFQSAPNSRDERIQLSSVVCLFLTVGQKGFVLPLAGLMAAVPPPTIL